MWYVTPCKLKREVPPKRRQISIRLHCMVTLPPRSVVSLVAGLSLRRLRFDPTVLVGFVFHKMAVGKLLRFPHSLPFQQRSLLLLYSATTKDTQQKHLRELIKNTSLSPSVFLCISTLLPIPEESSVHSHRRGKLKSNKSQISKVEEGMVKREGSPCFVTAI